MTAAGESASGDEQTLVVRPGGREHDHARDEFVRSCPRASFFHLSGWRDVAASHGHEPRDLLAWRGPRLAGVLPLMLCRAPFGSRNLISIPYGVYGGPAAEDAQTARALTDAAAALAGAEQVGRLELRHRYRPDDDWLGTDLYVTFVRDLPDAPEGVLAAMPKKARAEARKARERHGLELSEGVWYVDDLYRLFLSNKHSLGSPALPARHFKAVLERFQGEVYVHLVRQARRPLAAVMSFAFGDTLIAYYAGTEAEADRTVSASNFMYLALQEWAVEKGFRRFDFCRSRADSGAYSFKRHQGFEPEPLHYRYLLVRDKRPPSFTPSNPRTAALRRLWSRLPTWAVRRISEPISRYLP